LPPATGTHVLVAGITGIRMARKPALNLLQAGLTRPVRGPDNKEAARLAIRAELLSRIFAPDSSSYGR
jgi:hypothetical protein